MERADEPAAVLFGASSKNHQSLARWGISDPSAAFVPVITVSASTAASSGLKKRMLVTVSVRSESFKIAAKKRCEPLFNIRAAVAVASAHVGEVRVLRKRERDAVRIMAAEIFRETAAHLFDGYRIGFRGIRLALRLSSKRRR